MSLYTYYTLKKVGLTAENLTLGEKLAKKKVFSEKFLTPMLPLVAGAQQAHLTFNLIKVGESTESICKTKNLTNTGTYGAEAIPNLPNIEYCDECLDEGNYNYFSEILHHVGVLDAVITCTKNNIGEKIKKFDENQRFTPKEVFYQSKNMLDAFDKTKHALIRYATDEDKEKLLTYFFKEVSEVMQLLKEKVDKKLLKELFITSIQDALPLNIEVAKELEDLSIKNKLCEWRTVFLTQGEKAAAKHFSKRMQETHSTSFFYNVFFWPKTPVLDPKKYSDWKTYLKAEVEHNYKIVIDSMLKKLAEELILERTNLTDLSQVYYIDLEEMRLGENYYAFSRNYHTNENLNRLVLTLLSEKTSIKEVHLAPKALLLAKDLMGEDEPVFPELTILGIVEKADTPEILETAIALLKDGLDGQNALIAARKML